MLIHTAEEKDTRRKLPAAMKAQNNTRKLEKQEFKKYVTTQESIGFIHSTNTLRWSDIAATWKNERINECMKLTLFDKNDESYHTLVAFEIWKNMYVFPSFRLVEQKHPK